MLLPLLVPGVGMGGGSAAGVPATSLIWVEDRRPLVWHELRRSLTWQEWQRPLTIPTGDAMRATRRPGEIRTYTIDLSAEDEIVAGDTIASVGAAVAVPYNTGRTDSFPVTFGGTAVVSSGTLSGKAVTVPVTGGGTDGITYLIKAPCTTTAGKLLWGVIAEDCTWRPMGEAF